MSNTPTTNLPMSAVPAPDSDSPVLQTTNAPVTGTIQQPQQQPQQPQQQPANGAQSTAAQQPQPGVVKRTVENVGDGTRRALGDIFETLAGGKKKVWQQTPNGPVATYEDLKPGEMARGILAAAITGLASGYDPANRGKGPAMASAFSAGFKGEEQARERQANQAQAEAQKQFQNQNLSDELALRKHADARAQMDSISTMQKNSAETKLALQNAANGQTLFDQNQLDRKVRQQSDFNNLGQAGWKELPGPDGKPYVFASPREAEVAANNNPQAILHPGDFDTQPQYDPGRGGWVVMQKPKGYDEKQEVRFAKKDNNGQPMKGTDGNYVSDGTKDASGKAMTPVQMTGAQYMNWLKEQSDIKSKNATATEAYARAEELRSIQRKNDEISGAQDRMFKANNQPWAVDTDTGLPIMTNKDRSMLANAAHSQAAEYQAFIIKGNNELVTMDPKTPEAQELRSKIDQAQTALDENNRTMAALANPISRERAFAGSYVQRYTEDGQFDGKKALDAFDKNVKDGKYKTSWSPEEISRTRDLLQKAAQQAEIQKNAPQLPSDPTVQKAVNLFKNTPKEQIPGYISDSVAKGSLTQDQANQLYKFYGITPPKPAPNNQNPGITTPAALPTKDQVLPQASPEEQAAVRNFRGGGFTNPQQQNQ